jgi:hypothetical protein
MEALQVINVTLDELIAKCKALVDEEDAEFEEEFLSEADPSILHFLVASGEGGRGEAGEGGGQQGGGRGSGGGQGAMGQQDGGRAGGKGPDGIGQQGAGQGLGVGEEGESGWVQGGGVWVWMWWQEGEACLRLHD